MKTFILFCASFLVLTNFSCKKKASGGLGGNANLDVMAKHHGIELDSCTIFIKFNTLNAPADGKYDLEQKIQTDSIGKSYTIFSGLKTGDYYIYGYGFDPNISSDVKGGIPYTIKEETNYSIIVPVTETH